VPEKSKALERADVIVTATGARDVVTADDLPFLADDTVLMNVGHFPVEIDVPAIRAAAEATLDAADGIETLRLPDGRRLHVLTGGHMANLAGPRPLGNSIESMDLGFALQARCLEAVATGKATAADCVVPVPPEIDAAVAAEYIAIQSS